VKREGYGLSRAQQKGPEARNGGNEKKLPFQREGGQTNIQHPAIDARLSEEKNFVATGWK